MSSRKPRWLKKKSTDKPPVVNGFQIRYWTYDALCCLANNRDCQLCEVQAMLETKCQLKIVVKYMIDVLGLPTIEDCKRVKFDHERLDIWK